MLKVGMKAPAFCVPNQDEVEICLRDLEGKWIVLYFYPKDNTPGCTTQACDFTQEQPKFEKLNSIILGVSPDGSKKHQKFISKYNLDITLLCDEDKKMCENYGVWKLKKFMGKEYMGVERSTFIIDPKGNIASIWEKVSVRKKIKKNSIITETLHVNEVKNKLIELQE